MSKVKILQVCAIDGSVDALLKPLILRSMDEGYEVHNACTNTGKFEDLTSQGLKMIDIPIDRHISPVNNLKSIWKLYKLIKKERYDIVHVHTPVAALLGRVAAKMAGVRNIVYTAHGFYFHEGMSKKKYKLFFEIEKFATRRLTDWLLLQSKEDYELALKSNFRPKNQILHISNGVDITDKFNPKNITSEQKNKIRFELDIKEDDFVYMFIGRMVKEKGIFELIEAFKKVSRKHTNAKLILVGGIPQSERDQNSYVRLVEEFNNNNIVYLGFRKDIPALMSMSDVFVLPSHREGLPRSIIEAMAMAKPIIASNIRGCREEVFPGENGVLFEKENVDQLESAMLYLLNNHTVRENYSKRSREIAKELFNEAMVLEKQINLFNNLTSSQFKSGEDSATNAEKVI